jgi:hypothetical protein
MDVPLLALSTRSQISGAFNALSCDDWENGCFVAEVQRHLYRAQPLQRNLDNNRVSALLKPYFGEYE